MEPDHSRSGVHSDRDENAFQHGGPEGARRPSRIGRDHRSVLTDATGSDRNELVEIVIALVGSDASRQVNLQADSRFRVDASGVGGLKVRNNRGEMIPLGTLAKVRKSAGQ